jgi:hypothetical protein
MTEKSIRTRFDSISRENSSPLTEDQLKNSKCLGNSRTNDGLVTLVVVSSGLGGAVGVSLGGTVAVDNRGGGRGIISWGSLRGRGTVGGSGLFVSDSRGAVGVDNRGRCSVGLLRGRGAVGISLLRGRILTSLKVQEDIGEDSRFEEGKFAKKQTVNEGGSSDGRNGDSPEVQEGFGVSHRGSLGGNEKGGKADETRLYSHVEAGFGFV